MSVLLTPVAAFIAWCLVAALVALVVHARFLLAASRGEVLTERVARNAAEHDKANAQQKVVLLRDNLDRLQRVLAERDEQLRKAAEALIARMGPGEVNDALNAAFPVKP